MESVRKRDCLVVSCPICRYTCPFTILIHCLMIFSSLQKSLSTLEIQIDSVDSPVSLLTALAWESTAFFGRVKEGCLTPTTRWGNKLSEFSSLAYSLHYKLNENYGRSPRTFYDATPLRKGLPSSKREQLPPLGEFSFSCRETCHLCSGRTRMWSLLACAP